MFLCRSRAVAMICDVAVWKLLAKILLLSDRRHLFIPKPCSFTCLQRFLFHVQWRSQPPVSSVDHAPLTCCNTWIFPPLSRALTDNYNACSEDLLTTPKSVSYHFIISFRTSLQLGLFELFFLIKMPTKIISYFALFCSVSFL